MQKIKKQSEEEINVPDIPDTRVALKTNDDPLHIDLFKWIPEDDQIYFYFNSDPGDKKVHARFEEYYGIKRESSISEFKIKYDHYIKRMDDVCHHINYFITFFDTNKELYGAIFSVKFNVDLNPNMSNKAFRKMLLERVVTPTIVEKIFRMVDYLYVEDIPENNDARYLATPKLTSAHAKQILAISFCIRLVLPLLLHYANVNDNFTTNTSYIPFFDKVIMKIIVIFENAERGQKIFMTLCRFVEHRVDKYFAQHFPMWEKKKQLYGTVRSLYLDEIIHEVIIVKGLYKLDYRKPVVSFIDGIIFWHHQNFKQENFKTKPVEIDQYDTSTDNDNFLSHAESLEMQAYRVDASSAIFTDANINYTLKKIWENFRIEITQEEYQFYYDNLKISSMTQMFLHDFYARIFHDTNATIQLSKEDTIRLIILLKKYLQYKGMILLPQLCTATVHGKFKENLIKNAKFNETATTSDVHCSIVEDKYKYVDELFPGENINMRKLSALVNSELEFVDFDPNINGTKCADIDINRLVHEYDTFLAII